MAMMAVLGATPWQVQAQNWFVQPVVKGEVTATSNAGYSSSSEARSDVIVNVSPGLIAHGNMPRARLDAAFYVDAIGYVDGTQSNRLLPHGYVDLNSTLVERLLFIDTSASAAQTSQTPYAARPDGASSYNAQTTTQYHIKPYVERELAPNWQLNAHADNTWVRTSGGASGVATDPRNNAYVQDQFISVERKPVPFGGELQVGRQDTRYTGRSTSALVTDTARAIGSYSFYDELEVGLIGGHERDKTPYGEISDSIYGLRTRWQPNERTHLDATAEHRFFGLGWGAEFAHRTPFHAWTIRLSRQATTYANSLASLAAGGNVDQELDKILTTRFPDPVARSQEAQAIKARYGLPDNLAGPIDIYSETADLEQSASATYVYTGRRDTLACTYYVQRREPLVIPGTPDSLQPLLAPANSQQGLAFQFAHRLTPVMALDAQARWSRLSGRGASEGSYSRESVYRAGINWQLAPKTTGAMGLRWQHLRSNVATDAEETAMYVSLDHRF